MKSLTRQGAGKFVLLAAILSLTLTFNLSAQDATQGVRKILVKTAAVYPTLARSMNIHGVVKLEAVVQPNGTVKTIDVKGGHPLLTQSAVTAVGHWKFEAAPKESRETIEIKFED
jgi:TonB family protein